MNVASFLGSRRAGSSGSRLLVVARLAQAPYIVVRVSPAEYDRTKRGRADGHRPPSEARVMAERREEADAGRSALKVIGMRAGEVRDGGGQATLFLHLPDGVVKSKGKHPVSRDLLQTQQA